MLSGVSFLNITLIHPSSKHFFNLSSCTVNMENEHKQEKGLNTQKLLVVCALFGTGDHSLVNAVCHISKVRTGHFADVDLSVGGEVNVQLFHQVVKLRTW